MIMKALRFEQGDILTVEGIPGSVLVVSKNFFNNSEQAICCPLIGWAEADPLHIPITCHEKDYTVLCEQMKFLDLHIRGYKKVSSINYNDLLNILDTIQCIFDYY